MFFIHHKNLHCGFLSDHAFRAVRVLLYEGVVELCIEVSKGNKLVKKKTVKKQVSYESEIQTSRRMAVTKLYPLPRYIDNSKK